MFFWPLEKTGKYLGLATFILTFLLTSSWHYPILRQMPVDFQLLQAFAYTFGIVLIASLFAGAFVMCIVWLLGFFVEIFMSLFRKEDRW